MVKGKLDREAWWLFWYGGFVKAASWLGVWFLAFAMLGCFLLDAVGFVDGFFGVGGAGVAIGLFLGRVFLVGHVGRDPGAVAKLIWRTSLLAREEKRAGAGYATAHAGLRLLTRGREASAKEGIRIEGR